MSSWTFFILPTLKGSHTQVVCWGFRVDHFVLYQECVAVMAQRQMSDDEKGLFSTQAAALLPSPSHYLRMFSSLRFPHVLRGRASWRLKAKFTEDNESFHHLQGQGMELPVPRLVKGFPPFHLSP